MLETLACISKSPTGEYIYSECAEEAEGMHSILYLFLSDSCVIQSLMRNFVGREKERTELSADDLSDAGEDDGVCIDFP